MTLHKTIQQLLQANPTLSTEQIFGQVRPQFPEDNPSWMKARIANYRSKFKSKEKAFLLQQAGV